MYVFTVGDSPTNPCEKRQLITLLFFKALKGSSVVTCGGSKSGQVNKRVLADAEKLSLAASMIAKIKRNSSCIKERFFIVLLFIFI